MKKSYLKIFITGFILTIAPLAKSQYVWTPKVNFPGNARYFAACFSIGHYGYVGCGFDGSTKYTDWWKYNQNTNSWSSMAAYPGAGSIGCSHFSIGGKGYVGLGTNGTTAQTDLWQYDTSSNTWIAKASFPGTPRYGGFTFVVGTNAYVCTGNPGGPPYLSDCWMYNSLTNSWTQIANYPIANFGATAAFSLGAHGYVGCGGGSPTSTDTIYLYDTTTNTWSHITAVSSPNGLSCPAYFALGDTGYIVSGKDNSGHFLKDAYSYSPLSNSWSSTTPFAGIARWYGIAFTIGNTGYVTTGIDSLGRYLSDLWEYGPSPTGLTSISKKEYKINVYPNPSTGLFTVEMKGVESKSEIDIYNMLGEKVYSNSLSPNYSLSINLSNNSSGIYLYRIITETGEQVSSGKLVIE